MFYNIPELEVLSTCLSCSSYVDHQNRPIYTVILLVLSTRASHAQHPLPYQDIVIKQ